MTCTNENNSQQEDDYFIPLFTNASERYRTASLARSIALSIPLISDAGLNFYLKYENGEKINWKEEGF